MPSKKPMRKWSPYTCLGVVTVDRQHVRIPHISYIFVSWRRSMAQRFDALHMLAAIWKVQYGIWWCRMDTTWPCNRHYASSVHAYVCVLSNPLEESSKIVELVSIESKVLFHTRYVRIGLQNISLMSLWRCFALTTFVWSIYLNIYPKKPMERNHRSSFLT